MKVWSQRDSLTVAISAMRGTPDAMVTPISLPFEGADLPGGDPWQRVTLSVEDEDAVEKIAFDILRVIQTF